MKVARRKMCHPQQALYKRPDTQNKCDPCFSIISELGGKQFQRCYSLSTARRTQQHSRNKAQSPRREGTATLVQIWLKIHLIILLLLTAYYSF